MRKAGKQEQRNLLPAFLISSFKKSKHRRVFQPLEKVTVPVSKVWKTVARTFPILGKPSAWCRVSAMKRWLLLLCACALTLTIPLRADEPKSPNAQKLCPVMNLPINPKLYVDFEGKRIYVCCPHCLEKVKENPKKFIRQLESEGITLEPVPKEVKK